MGEICIAVDVMGGDYAPEETIKGCAQALAQGDSRVKLLLVGQEDKIRAEVAKHSMDTSRYEIIDAPEVIGTDEVPTTAIRQKKQSSIVVGLQLVKKGEAGAFVSAGSTGAVLAGATLIVGRIKGVERPALATILPNEKGWTFHIDVGANVDAKPSYLVQFAQMGAIYMESIMGIENPRVGLVNIGAEKEKGNALTKEAYGLLEAAKGINFTGNVEPRDIPLGAVDVVVCDAFVGNVILKYSEGFAKAMLGMIKEELMGGLLSKIGALLSKGAFKNLKKRFDYAEVGGAPFLGLTGLVVKAHGSSNARAFQNAIRQCSEFIDKDITGKITQSIQLNQRTEPVAQAEASEEA